MVPISPIDVAGVYALEQAWNDEYTLLPAVTDRRKAVCGNDTSVDLASVENDSQINFE
jgi:hypothetical protein